ncbi:MAG: TOBE domain-containing protein, partial [Ensifer adhaerens]
AALPGTISTAAYLGGHIEYEVETQNGLLFVVDDAIEEMLSPSTEVAIGFRNRGLALITA